MKNGFKIYFAALLLAALAAVVVAQQPVPLPVVVNTDPAGSQTQPAVVADSNGALLVAWRDSLEGGRGILLQGFDWLGHRTGPVVQSSGQLYDDAFNPAMAVNLNGRAVLCWQELDGGVSRIAFRRFNIDASPASEGSVENGSSPSVAIDLIGRVALVWAHPSESSGSDIIANLFAHDDSAGVANTDTLVYGWVGYVRINEADSGEQDSPSVAMDRKGGVLVAWRDLRTDSLGIFCRAFSERGIPLGSFRLGGLDPGGISRLGAPVVAATMFDGNYSSFMVSWVETDTLDRNRLMRARVDLELFSVPPVMTVDTLYTKVVRQRSGLKFETPALSGNEDGEVTLVWSEFDGELDQLYGMMFNSSDEGLTQVLPLTSSDQGFGAPASNPALFTGKDGSFALAWQDFSRGDPDIRLQRYTATGQVERPLYLSPGSGDGANRAVSFLGLPGGGYEMFWEHDREGSQQIYRASFDNAGRLQEAPGPVYPDGSSQRRPVTASGRDGLQVLAWEDSDALGYRVVLSIRRQEAGAQFERKVLSSPTSSHLGSLAAAIGPEGKIYMLWERWSQGASAPDLMLARVDSSGNKLGSQITVAAASGGGGRMASAAAGPGGNLMVAWRAGSSAAENAKIVARVYSSTGSVVRNQIAVSRDTLEYIGSISRPEVAASDSTGNFLVLWREFYSDRNLLYYRLYNADGDSLQLPGGQWRSRLGSAAALNDADRSYGSASVAVDSTGGFLVVWSESDPTSSPGLFGARLDPHGAPLGAQFQVPGVAAAALPVVSILEQQRVAVAWQDTIGAQISFLGVQLHFHSLLGQVLLASSGFEARELKVHVEGVAADSASVAVDGGFRFRSLPGGSYRVWVSAQGTELAGTSRVIELASSDPPEVDMGIAADLGGTPGLSLPRAGAVDLAQNSPNPFNPSTTVSFSVGGEQPLLVILAVYDIRGARVRTLLNELVEPGTRRIEWDGRDGKGRQLSSGIYFLRLSAGSQTRVRKMILLK